MRCKIQNICSEKSNILLNDGAYKLFFNTTGHDEIKKEFAQLLQYVNNPNVYPVDKSDNDWIHKIEEAGKAAKTSPE